MVRVPQPDDRPATIEDLAALPEHLKGEIRGAGREAETYERVARAIDEAAASIQRLPLTIASLKAYAAEYEQLLRRFAKVMSDVAKGMRGKDPDVLKASSADLQSVIAAESKLIVRINTHCGVK
jgi:hypothetical protein